MPDVVFDETVAKDYDSLSQEKFEPAVLGPTVDFLAALAGEGAALEFGVGTGRVAIPLSRRGVPVHGIDLSEPMIARMRAKPGGDAIGVTIGDIATTRVRGEFALVYLPFNVITNLTTQEAQVACFRNAAAHLSPGGTMAAEVFVPPLQRLPRCERFLPFTVTSSHLGFDEYDVVNQGCTSHHYFIAQGRAQLFDSQHRYAWPSELDLMAQLAGLRLRERWADWRRSPFTDESENHVSVWERSTR